MTKASSDVPGPPGRNPVVVLRGLFRRCPYCGGGKIFSSWFRLKPACPRCGFDFEREPGWWIGGLIVNMAAVLAAFSATFAIGVIAFWPDVPWGWVQIANGVAITLTSIFFYPMSKTVWLGIDLLMTGDPAPRK